MNYSASFFILPPEFLIYLFAFNPFFQIKLDSFSTAPIVETNPLLDAIFISSPSWKISSVLDILSKSRETIFPSLFRVEAFKLEYLVKPPVKFNISENEVFLNSKIKSCS